MNYKPRYNMAGKGRPNTEADKAGMNDLLARVKEKREVAIKAQQELMDDEDVKTVEGVRQEADLGFLTYGE